jgi:hypothetical protein
MTEKGPKKATLYQLIKNLPVSERVAVEHFLDYLQNKRVKQTMQRLAGESAPYDTDFYGWTQIQAAALRDEELKWLKDLDLDLDNLAEEIESLGNEQRHAIRSHLRNLLLHLLKWRYQTDRRGESWFASIDNAREEIADRLEINRSLRPELEAFFAWAYPRARRKAQRQTGIPLDTFPETCPWPLERVLDEDFFPEAPAQ